MGTAKPDKARASLDRRSGQDRRRAYDMDYFLDGGTERRRRVRAERRRKTRDRRRNWIKISRWSSLNVGSAERAASDEPAATDIE